MTPLSRRSALFLGLGMPALLSACANTSAPPTGPADPSGLADPEMRALLESLASLNPKPVETLSPLEARLQPGLGDAVKNLLRQTGKSTDPRPLPLVRDISIPGPGGALPARVYSSAQIPERRGQKPLPLIVYFHGGGWVLGNLDTYDSSCRALSADANAVVVSVDYRKAPENKFPAAHDDAYAAYVWAVRNATVLGADPNKVAIVGESAGGNLALATDLRRDVVALGCSNEWTFLHLAQGLLEYETLTGEEIGKVLRGETLGGDDDTPSSLIPSVTAIPKAGKPATGGDPAPA